MFGVIWALRPWDADFPNRESVPYDDNIAFLHGPSTHTYVSTTSSHSKHVYHQAFLIIKIDKIHNYLFHIRSQ